jgi:hypothetical protein
MGNVVYLGVAGPPSFLPGPLAGLRGAMIIEVYATYTGNSTLKYRIESNQWVRESGSPLGLVL